MEKSEKICKIITDIKNGDVDAFTLLYESLFDFFVDEYKNFSFIPESIYNEINHQILYLVVNNYSEKDDFYKELKLNFSSLIYKKLSDYIILDPKIIHLFLLKEKKSFLQNFCDFLIKCQYKENIDNSLFILENNPLVIKELNELFSDIKEISEKDLIKISKSLMMKHILQVYCLLKDINIIYEQKELSDYSEIYLVDDQNVRAENDVNVELYFLKNGKQKDNFLTKAEEFELSERYIKYNDEEALKKLINANLLLSANIAKRFIGCGLTVEDLIQEGNLGLVIAARRFDYKKGFRFSTYATFWIRKQIIIALNEQSRTIRIPCKTLKSINQLTKISEIYLKKHGKNITIEELAIQSKLPVDKVATLLECKENFKMKSINEKIIDDEITEISDMIASPNNGDVLSDSTSLQKDVRKLMNEVELTEREKIIVLLRNGFIKDKLWNLEDIGQILGISRETVRKDEIRAYAKFRKYKFIKEMAVYLDDPDIAIKTLEYGVKLCYTKGKNPSTNILEDYSLQLKKSRMAGIK